jgi:hypothetical protein
LFTLSLEGEIEDVRRLAARIFDFEPTRRSGLFGMNYSTFRPAKRPVYFASYSKYRGGAGFVRANEGENNLSLMALLGWRSGSYKNALDPQLAKDVDAFTEHHKMKSTGGLLNADVTLLLLDFYDKVEAEQASIDFDEPTNNLLYKIDLSQVKRDVVSKLASKGGGGGLSMTTLALIAAGVVVGAAYFTTARK